MIARPTAPELRDRVAMFWTDRHASTTGGMLALPEGTVEIVFDLDNADRPPVVCGPHARPFWIEGSGPTTIVGVHVRPGGARGLFGVPMSDLRDVVAPLDAFWGREAHLLEERLVEARTCEARLALLEAALGDRARRSRDGHAAVAASLRATRRERLPSIADLSWETGLSARRLGTLFHEEVGLPPKLYVRLRRFQRALRAAWTRPDWGEVAALAGYCDQSHLVRDFHDFIGLTPTAYAARRAHHPNHVV